jgi:hypothetical protein
MLKNLAGFCTFDVKCSCDLDGCLSLRRVLLKDLCPGMAFLPAAAPSCCLSVKFYF